MNLASVALAELSTKHSRKILSVKVETLWLKCLGVVDWL